MKLYKRIGLLLFIFAFLFTSCKLYPVVSYPGAVMNDGQNDDSQVTVVTQSLPFRVVFMNVGMAEAILVQEVETGAAMLVDAGTKEAVDIIRKHFIRYSVKKIDVLVLTHPHDDRIGGAISLIKDKSLPIGNIYMPNYSVDSDNYTDLMNSINKRGLKITNPKAGSTIQFGQKSKVEVLAPVKDEYYGIDAIDESSIVLKITYGKISFLLTGDGDNATEFDMMNAGYDLRADVLKIANHGAEFSTGNKFLDAVRPRYAVISVGKYNPEYPNAKVLERIKQFNIKEARTDKMGHLIFLTDGDKLTVGRLTKF